MAGSAKVWEEIQGQLAEVERKRVRIGIIGKDAGATHADGDSTNAEIGLFMEFGTEWIPERSFLRKTFRNPAVLAEARALQQRLIRAILEKGMDVDRALGLLGAWAVSKVRETIIDGDISPPLAASTIAAKGSSRPLVDTGQLVSSISWVIVS